MVLKMNDTDVKQKYNPIASLDLLMISANAKNGNVDQKIPLNNTTTNNITLMRQLVHICVIVLVKKKLDSETAILFSQLGFGPAMAEFLFFFCFFLCF